MIHRIFSLADLEAVFKTFDKNNDGTISASELKEVLEKCGCKKVTDAEVEEILKKVDKDGKNRFNILITNEPNRKAYQLKRTVKDKRMPRPF